MPHPTIGLALGSGSSRGWAHIGVIQALAKLGIEPAIVCGTSIGAVVGASYVAGNMGKLEQWACALSKGETSSFFEFATSFTGFVNKERFDRFLTNNVTEAERAIEEFPKRYAAVATNLKNGREVWLNKGPVHKAIWASAALPGLFPAVNHDGHWLVDGGLVNPVPVSVCRALGADVVIAVNLNGDLVGRHFEKAQPAPKPPKTKDNSFTGFIREYTEALFSSDDDADQPPNIFDAIAGSINIVQDRITRSRLAGDPPDVLLSPKLAHIGLLEFHRAGEAILEGSNSVMRMEEEILHVFDKVF